MIQATAVEMAETAVAAFRPVLGAWACAAGVEVADVAQEVRFAVLRGEDPARAVPRALGIRRVAGAWRSTDAAPAAVAIESLAGAGAELPAPEVEAQAALPPMLEALLDAAAGGTAAMAERDGITRRGAQLRLAAQVRRLKEGADLFRGGSA